jgi:hypothetical protein
MGNKNYLIMGITIVTIAVISFFSIPKKPYKLEPIVTTNRKVINLKPDANFLDCIAIQHKCIYDHLNKNQFFYILEDCKDEDYCNNISR